MNISLWLLIPGWMMTFFGGWWLGYEDGKKIMYLFLRNKIPNKSLEKKVNKFKKRYLK